MSNRGDKERYAICIGASEKKNFEHEYIGMP